MIWINLLGILLGTAHRGNFCPGAPGKRKKDREKINNCICVLHGI